MSRQHNTGRKAIIRNISAKANIDEAWATQSLDAFLATIRSALAQGRRIEVRGFGSFHTTTRKGRVGRNPKSGAAVVIPDRKEVRFKTRIRFRGEQQ
jgi:DNA-binding protein HU-beta